MAGALRSLPRPEGAATSSVRICWRLRMGCSIGGRKSVLLGFGLTAVATLAAIFLLRAPAPAEASANQLALFEEGNGLQAGPTRTLSTLRSLGVGAVRLSLRWQDISPDPRSAARPRGFDAADPAAYPASAWTRDDEILQTARADGLGVVLTVGGGAPLWATGHDQPTGGPYLQWKPSAAEYQQFVQAVATRYSGHYSTCASCSPLPRVSFWEIWNEPNWGPSLAPQATNGSRTSTSPGIYRGLLDAGWQALQRTGHGHDTVVVGSLSPRGFSAPPSSRFPQGLPASLSTTKPLQFVRTLYCVDSLYHELRGTAAKAVDCPSTAAASRAFRGQHPALFNAGGFGIHPYPFDLPPTEADSNDPDYVEFNEIPRLSAALDRVQRVYGSGKRLQIYNTEYGYETNPPNRSDHFVSPATAATYVNWAEYLSWRNPRVATTMQYLLYDPKPTVGQATFGYGSFASGLIFYHGPPKADYYAYRMPIFLPVTSTPRRRSLEVWGCVRPAHLASSRQSVQIQFRAGSRGAFRTVKTVPIRSARGYFDVKLAFPSSGAVRSSWRYPSGQTIYSRTVNITVR
jgi:hypothetical protein